MGSDNSKVVKPIQKFDIEIVCDKIYHHLILQRDRKINELAGRERELRDKLKNRRRNYEDTVLDISALVNIFKYIKASKMVIRYCQIIKEHSNAIVASCNSKNY